MLKSIYNFFNNIAIKKDWKFAIYTDEGKKVFSLGNVPQELDTK